MAADENTQGSDFLIAFMEHAKNLTSFEKSHHRREEPLEQELVVSSLEHLAMKGTKRGVALKTVRENNKSAAILKVFPRSTDKE